jgi:uncharacterized protein (DUF305 family)
MKVLPLNWRQFRIRRDRKPKRGSARLVMCTLFAASIFAAFFSCAARAQQTGPAKPVVVQPGVPGAPSKTLPASSRATLPPRSQADVEFMQGMIMHHEQAVEMTAMIPSHTQNKDLQSLGARISSSQSDEIKFMERWLAARGELVPKAMPQMTGMEMTGMDMTHDAAHDISHDTSHDKSLDKSFDKFFDTMARMPGMLTPRQMEALKKAKGGEFDHLFLVGMIQHHNGALTMVKDLFDTAGAGQDAELFNFATDADNSQRAEIRIMETMLKKDIPEENR